VDGMNYVLLDTEGLDDASVSESTARSLKLFVMTILLSSCMVVNIMKVLGEAEVKQLGCVRFDQL